MSPAARQLDELAVKQPFLDYSRGVIGGVTELGRPVRHLRRANNVIFEPVGEYGVRRGYRDITSAVLADQPHSPMRYYNAAGNVTFIGTGAKIQKFTDVAITNQALPFAPSTNKWSHANLNGVLVAAQEGGTEKPIAYNGTDWLSIVLPAPVAAPTFAADTNAGGVVDAGTHYWRIRWRFKNGSSIAGPASAARVVAAPNQTINITGLTASGRSDYLGWTIERTKATDATLWYKVADGAGATYQDLFSDAALSELIGAEPGVHGSCPHLDGLIAWKDLLIGWVGSNLWISQSIGGPEASGSFNFHPLHFIPVRADDGDSIQLCVPQGDRLIVQKAASTHSLEGFDWESFRLTEIDNAVGCVSTRGATSIAGQVFFYAGAQRLFRLGSTGAPVRIGDIEVSHYLATLDTTREANLEMHNHRGDYLVIAYTATPDTYNRDALAWRRATGVWTHWVDMRIGGALVPRKRDDLSGASFIFCDPKDFGSGGSHVYHVWSGFDGTADERTSTGGGGVPINIFAELPECDDGEPDVLKMLTRIELYIRTGVGTLTINASLDAGSVQASVPVTLNLSGPRWGKSGSAPTANTLVWGPGPWVNYPSNPHRWGASNRSSEIHASFPPGVVGKKYKLSLAAALTADVVIGGHVLDYRRLPDRKP